MCFTVLFKLVVNLKFFLLLSKLKFLKRFVWNGFDFFVVVVGLAIIKVISDVVDIDIHSTIVLTILS